MAGVGQGYNKNGLVAGVQKKHDDIFRSLSDGKPYFFFQVWEKSVERRRQALRPLDLGHIRLYYFGGRHLHSLALPNSKRVGRGLSLFRNRMSIVP